MTSHCRLLEVVWCTLSLHAVWRNSVLRLSRFRAVAVCLHVVLRFAMCMSNGAVRGKMFVWKVRGGCVALRFPRGVCVCVRELECEMCFNFCFCFPSLGSVSVLCVVDVRHLGAGAVSVRCLFVCLFVLFV